METPSLFSTCQIFLRIMCCYGAVCSRRYNLTKRLRPHISCGIYAGDSGFGRLAGDDVASFIKVKLVCEEIRSRFSAYSDENAVAVYGGFLAGLLVLYAHSRNLAAVG